MDAVDLQKAAVILAGSPLALEALLLGRPVPRRHLHPGALRSIDEPLEGPDVEIDETIALRIRLARDVGIGEPAPDDEREPDWFESAADLLTEDDPGRTPFLIEDLIVDQSIAAFVGPPKVGKTWTLLDSSIAVSTGEDALGRFSIEKPGPVLLILEESGRRALHRRLDKLTRGRAVKPERLAEFYFAANKRVRLDDDVWRRRLLAAARSREWRLIAFDPLARIKGLVDEDRQKEMGPVLDFLRELRAESGATVAYVHHTGHEGTRQRGSSDLEAYWESKVTLTGKDGKRSLKAEHREAEAAGPFLLSFGFDAATGTLRVLASDGELGQRVRDYLEQHPEASANEVDENVEGTRTRILELVRQYREGGSDSAEPLRTTPSGSGSGGGSAGGAYEAPRTTPADLESEVVRTDANHPESGAVDADEVERLADRAREMEPGE